MSTNNSQIFSSLQSESARIRGPLNHEQEILGDEIKKVKYVNTVQC